jgi:hypothetical protein
MLIAYSQQTLCVEDLVESAVDGESEGGKGPWRSTHPPDLVTRIVANSFNKAWNWPPCRLRWLTARGTKRRVAEDWIGPVERESFLSLIA